MNALKNKVAIVTGASSGIGRAIALALASHGADLALVGRNLIRLKKVAKDASKTSSRVRFYQLDLSSVSDIHRFEKKIKNDFNRVDLLIHSAGIISLGSLESSSLEDFDTQYKINVRAPLALTQIFLPEVKKSKGQIVFINSSTVKNTKKNVGYYAATKHALKSLADTLRLEVNEGVRVISIYPGQTATPMQKKIFKTEGNRYNYNPEALMQPQDVVEMILLILKLPRTIEVTDIFFRSVVK